MEWLAEHLQLIVVIAGAVAYWLNKRRNSSENAEENHPPLAEQDPHGDIEQAERVRRIQEEIRRKIMERVSGAPAGPVPQRSAGPPPLHVPEARGDVVESKPQPRPAMTAYAADEEVLERQRQLADQMRKLERRRRAEVRRALEIGSENPQPAARSPQRSLLSELRDPQTARRAIVLREVLGTPAGLR